LVHLLKRQGLVKEAGGKGMRVVARDPLRVIQLYQAREDVDGSAARLAAVNVAARTAKTDEMDILKYQLAVGAVFNATTPISTLVRADTEFHRALYRLSDNPVIEEITAPL
jgi:DNA-binding GntR family transcriptional regulator